MATRAIKKLTKTNDLKKLSELAKEDEDQTESDSEPQLAPVNKFDLLGALDKEEDFEDEKEKSDEEEETSKPVVNENKKSKKKQKSKKKGNASGGFKYVSSNIDEDDENDLTSKQGASSELQTGFNREENEKVRKVLQIEVKNLNADNEMIRIFGARIVQGERNDPRNRRTIRMRNTIVNRKPTWPEFRKGGLSMKLLKEEAQDKTSEFAFEHSTDYQKIQFLFLDAIDSLDHNNIINVLHLNPYHIDSLIQLSEVTRIHDDTQMAADLIERALFAFQNTFHPAFNLSKSSGGQLRLDYNRVENRGLFISLFKHTLYIGGKACYRTSLELSKLLLSLDYINDPLAALLLIDFYAIRSSQYEYLVEFYECFAKSKSLDLMPNMCLSLALAYFYLSKKSGNESMRAKADEKLRDALLKFPVVLMLLLDKCGVMPDKRAESSSIFSKVSHLKTPTGLKLLVDLYVERMHHEWKIAENLEWLELTVRAILDEEKSLLNSVNETKKRWQSLFAKVPSNVYRHIILCDLKEVPVNLPPLDFIKSYPSSATYSFDPVPPKNTIKSYERPEKTRNQEGGPMTTDSLLAFFQSLMPNFNAANRAGAGEGENVGAAEAGAAAAAAEPRAFNMNQMVNRLREFLVNVEHHFPPAAGNNQGDNQNAEYEEDPDIDEFD